MSVAPGWCPLAARARGGADVAGPAAVRDLSLGQERSCADQARKPWTNRVLGPTVRTVLFRRRGAGLLALCSGDYVVD